MALLGHAVIIILGIAAIVGGIIAFLKWSDEFAGIVSSGRSADSLRRRPEDLARPIYNEAKALMNEESFSEAVKKYREIVAIAPDDPKPHYEIGVIYAENLGEPVRAIRALEDALELAEQMYAGGNLYLQECPARIEELTKCLPSLGVLPGGLDPSH